MSDILKVTVRIEVPVVFPFDPDSTVTWDELGAAAIEAVEHSTLTGLLARAEMVALRGPGSGGHYYGESADEIMAEPHLDATLPVTDKPAKPKRRLRCRASVVKKGAWHSTQCEKAAVGDMLMRVNGGDSASFPACGQHRTGTMPSAYTKDGTDRWHSYPVQEFIA